MKSRVLLTKFFKEQLIVMLTELCTEIWSHKIFWSIVKELSSLLISVLPVHSGYPLKLTLMKLLLFGTELQKFSWDKSNTQPQLISGLLVVLWQRWHKEKHYLPVIQKLIRSSKYSRFRELLTRITGQLHWSFQTSRQHSQSGRVFQCLNMPKTLMSMVLTYSKAWLLLNHTKEFLAEWLYNIHILMILIRVKSLRISNENPCEIIYNIGRTLKNKDQISR